MNVLLWLAGFGLGSVPFGYLMAKARGVDIRAIGSGNIGATNVMRALGRGPGILVFLLDLGKGAAPVLVGYYVLHLPYGEAVAGGLCAVLGHVFSPFLKFKGGKGVATSLGAIMAAAPLPALAAFGVFFVMMALTRYVSLSSIAAALCAPGFALWFGAEKLIVWTLVGIAGLFVTTHRANIKRLWSGTEPKFGAKRSNSSTQVESETTQPAGPSGGSI